MLTINYKTMKNTINIIYKKFTSLSRLKKIIIIISIILALMFILNILSLNKQILGILELRKSYQASNLCHESCSARRRELEKMIVKELKHPYIKILLKRYFKSPQELKGFKKEIIRINSLNNKDKPPYYLMAYLNNDQGDIDLQADIIHSFNLNEDINRFFQLRLRKIIDNNSHENIKAISYLDIKMNVDYVFSKLNSSRSDAEELAFITLLSNLNKKDFSKEQLNTLRNLALSINISSELRQAIVFLLSDVYIINDKEIGEILDNIYKEMDQDIMTKAIISDFMNRQLGGNKYLVPEIKLIN